MKSVLQSIQNDIGSMILVNKKMETILFLSKNENENKNKNKNENKNTLRYK